MNIIHTHTHTHTKEKLAMKGKGRRKKSSKEREWCDKSIEAKNLYTLQKICSITEGEI
jgi:hypothetical protein